MKTNNNILLLILILFLSSVSVSFAGGELPENKKKNKVKNKENSPVGLTYKSGFKGKDDGFHDYFLTIQLGGFWAYNDAKVKLNSPELEGTEIDLERDFDLSNNKFFPRADVIFRIGKRHQIAASFFDLSRKKSLVLDRTVSFGDTTFYVNSGLDAKFRFTSYGLEYRFSIIKTPLWEAGVLLGAKGFKVYSKAEAHLNGYSYGVTKQYWAPVPLPGVHALVNLGKHVVLRGVGDYFQLSLDDWNFKVWEVRPGIEIYPIENLGISFYYHYLVADVNKVPDEDLNGYFKYRINAVSGQVALRF